MAERPATLHQRDRLDRAIELSSGATAAGMFAYGVALSYQVLHAIAAAAGLPSWAARLWPLGFEAFMASAALNAQRPEAGGPRREAGGCGDGVQDLVGQGDAVGEHAGGGGAA